MKLTFAQAINRAIYDKMEEDPSVIVYGIGVPDHKKIFGTTNYLQETFGEERVFDTPLSEDALMGFGIGAAIGGMRPIYTHIRVDFLLLAMNELVNMASTIAYGSNGQLKCPMVIRVIIGRGWGQGFQHSKTLHSYFSHIPGIKTVSPTTPKDAYLLMRRAIEDNEPTVFLEHRWLHWAEEDFDPKTVPQIDFGQSTVLRPGNDFTIIGTNWTNIEALRAAELLEKYHGLSVEVVDPRSFYPLDGEGLRCSVDKTKNCLIVDNDWVPSGFGAEIFATLYESELKSLFNIQRLGMEHIPCPTTRPLETEFYPNAKKIVRKVEAMMNLKAMSEENFQKENMYDYEHRFKGPF